jgi:hypothetical protein
MYEIIYIYNYVTYIVFMVLLLWGDFFSYNNNPLYMRS